jgi:NADH:ubiquinone oxidoreductase subunit 6 (subunit J)
VGSRRILVALGAILILVAVTALLMGWPIEKAIYLAPVIVIAGAAAVGLCILWGKIAVQSLRESRRPRLVLFLWIGGLALLVLLTILGVKLPKGE